MDGLTPPLDYTAIERILPHRYPFLLVDRVTDFKTDAYIVGIKNVSSNERYLAKGPSGELTLPFPILTEALAQVGAILILSKPEHRDKLIFFRGIEKVRYYRPVRPGDVVVMRADAVRLRGRVGVLQGTAHVGDQRVAAGSMTFALGQADDTQR